MQCDKQCVQEAAGLHNRTC